LREKKQKKKKKKTEKKSECDPIVGHTVHHKEEEKNATNKHALAKAATKLLTE